MTAESFPRVASFKTVERFQEHLRALHLTIPCDAELMTGSESPLQTPLLNGSIRVANRIAAQPMEGWDGAADGQPTDRTFRRWQNFGRSGAKLIWGGEAVAVSHEG